jgi:DNA-binding NarL/FixJ family response regulator
VEHYVEGPRPGSEPPPAVGTLTERETAILRAMAAGLSNAEIARQLYLGESTVKTHVTHVLAKLGVRDRLQAVVYAYENGIVRAGENAPR